MCGDRIRLVIWRRHRQALTPADPPVTRGERIRCACRGGQSASFDVAPYFIRPEGATTKQPRATPGVAFARCSTEPCKGDTSPVGCCALSGLFPLFFAVFRVPRALPWAVLSGPFGAKTTDCATSKRASGANCDRADAAGAHSEQLPRSPAAVSRGTRTSQTPLRFVASMFHPNYNSPWAFATSASKMD
jgi:hypothetical protein